MLRLDDKDEIAAIKGIKFSFLTGALSQAYCFIIYGAGKRDEGKQPAKKYNHDNLGELELFWHPSKNSNRRPEDFAPMSRKKVSTANPVMALAVEIWLSDSLFAVIFYILYIYIFFIFFFLVIDVNITRCANESSDPGLKRFWRCAVEALMRPSQQACSYFCISHHVYSSCLWPVGHAVGSMYLTGTLGVSKEIFRDRCKLVQEIQHL